jgi:hypothetical protein
MAEAQAYVGRVSREVELRVDGIPAPLSLIESNFPTLEAMQEGLGTIGIKLRTARRGHELRFENRHLPQVSVYLVDHSHQFGRLDRRTHADPTLVPTLLERLLI